MKHIVTDVWLDVPSIKRLLTSPAASFSVFVWAAEFLAVASVDGVVVSGETGLSSVTGSSSSTPFRPDTLPDSPTPFRPLTVCKEGVLKINRIFSPEKRCFHNFTTFEPSTYYDFLPFSSTFFFLIRGCEKSVSKSKKGIRKVSWKMNGLSMPGPESSLVISKSFLAEFLWSSSPGEGTAMSFFTDITLSSTGNYVGTTGMATINSTQLKLYFFPTLYVLNY